MPAPSKTFFYTISALECPVFYLTKSFLIFQDQTGHDWELGTRPIVAAFQIAHACKNYFFSVQEAAPTKLIKNADFVKLPNFL